MNQKNTHDVHEIVTALMADSVEGTNNVGIAKRVFRNVTRLRNLQATREMYVVIMSQNGQHVLTKDFS